MDPSAQVKSSHWPVALRLLTATLAQRLRKDPASHVMPPAENSRNWRKALEMMRHFQGIPKDFKGAWDILGTPWTGRVFDSF